MTKRNLQDLAKEAAFVQDACNLTGVLHSFARAMGELRELCPDDYVRHPIARAWVDKVCSLTGYPQDFGAETMQAHRWVMDAVDLLELARVGYAEEIKREPLIGVVPASDIDPAKGLRASDYLRREP